MYASYRVTDVKYIIGGSCYKYKFCRDKSFGTNTCTKVRLFATKLLTGDLHNFVATKDLFCCEKHVFVLSLPNSVCCDNYFVATSIFCRDITVVATKMILMAAPAVILSVVVFILFYFLGFRSKVLSE